jgi:hypothetical protein
MADLSVSTEASGVLRRPHRSDIIGGLVAGLLTFVVAAYYAPRGFDAGFVDMGHDGYVLKVATDLCDGAVLFRDVFTQYGVLGDRLNCLVLKVDDSLLFLKYSYAFLYLISGFLVYYLTARVGGMRWAVSLTAFFLLSAPFYRHGIMLSVQAIILPLQLVSLAAMMRFVNRGGRLILLVVGTLSGLVFLFKQSAGIYQVGALAIAVLVLAGHGRGWLRVRQAVMAAAIVVAGFIVVALSAIAYEWWTGSLGDWYAQTVQFPRAFYTEYSLTEYGFFSRDRYSGLLGFVTPLVPWPVWVVWDAFLFQMHWMLLRVSLVAIAVVAIIQGWNRRMAVVVLAFIVMGTLINFPSFNFMHQWWSTVPVLPAVPYLIMPLVWQWRVGSRVVDAAGFVKVSAAQVASGAGRFLRENAAACLAAPLYAILVMAALGTIAGDGNGLSVTGGNLSPMTSGVACNKVETPPRLEGMCASPSRAWMRRNLETVTTALQDTLAEQRLRAPGASYVSIERTDGVSDIARSLLPIAALTDNSTSNPATWQLPILRDLYPDSLRRNYARGDLLLDYGLWEEERDVPGYRIVRWIVNEEDLSLAWMLYAPIMCGQGFPCPEFL